MMRNTQTIQHARPRVSDHFLAIDMGDFRPRTGGVRADVTVADAAELTGRITRLEHSEADLSSRLAQRAAQLDTPLGAPCSDPLYQRHFFALAWLREQIAGAKEELSRSSTGSRAMPKA